MKTTLSFSDNYTQKIENIKTIVSNIPPTENKFEVMLNNYTDYLDKVSVYVENNSLIPQTIKLTDKNRLVINDLIIPTLRTVHNKLTIKQLVDELTDIDYQVNLSVIDLPLHMEIDEWNIRKKSEYILTILRDINISKIAYIKTNDGVHHIIDGVQRLKTIVDFVNNDTPIIYKGVYHYYSELSKELYDKFNNTLISVDVMKYEKLSDIKPIYLINWYKNSNYNLDQNTIDYLNRLEIMLSVAKDVTDVQKESNVLSDNEMFVVNGDELKTRLNNIKKLIIDDFIYEGAAIHFNVIKNIDDRFDFFKNVLDSCLDFDPEDTTLQLVETNTSLNSFSERFRYINRKNNNLFNIGISYIIDSEKYNIKVFSVKI